MAASAIVDAFERHDFQFADYRSRILRHPWLGTLVSRYRGASWLYRLVRYPRLAGWLWRLAPALFRVYSGIRPDVLPTTERRLVGVGD